MLSQLTILKQRPALAANVRLQTGAERAALLFPEGLLELNETAGAIVQLCDGERRTSDIVEQLAAEYSADGAEIVQDVEQCLRDLLQRKLLVLRT